VRLRVRQRPHARRISDRRGRARLRLRLILEDHGQQ
jgi:hypothetical protein